MMKKIGTIGVDTGQFIIGDPCYGADLALHPHTESHDLAMLCHDVIANNGGGNVKPFDKTKTDAHGITKPTAISYAVCGSTGYGDGAYPVYAEYNNDGRLVALTINFLDDADTEGDACDRQDDDAIVPTYVSEDSFADDQLSNGESSRTCRVCDRCGHYVDARDLDEHLDQHDTGLIDDTKPTEIWP